MKIEIYDKIVLIQGKHFTTVMLKEDIWKYIWKFDDSNKMPRKRKKEIRSHIGFNRKQIEELYTCLDKDYISTLL